MAVPRTFRGLVELRCGCVVEIVQSSIGQVVPLHHEYIPREGTELAEVQSDVMAKAWEEEQQMIEEERQEVEWL